MIEFKQDVIDTLGELADDYPQFSAKWNKIADCIVYLNEAKIEEEDEG